MSRNNTVLDELLEDTQNEKKTKPEVEVVDREKDFNVVKSDVIKDIDHVDLRMAQIQSYITALDATVTKTKTALASENDPNKRSKLYGIMNQALEMIATFEGLYLKAMEVKHRYRQDQADFLLKKVKLLEIELRKMDSDDAAGLNTPKLVEMINALQSKLDATATKTSEAEAGKEVSKQIGNIIDIEDDPKYRL